MICKPCGEANHSNCKNIGTESETWCDCQHLIKFNPDYKLSDEDLKELAKRFAGTLDQQHKTTILNDTDKGIDNG